jgi:hypothetical protein
MSATAIFAQSDRASFGGGPKLNCMAMNAQRMPLEARVLTLLMGIGLFTSSLVFGAVTLTRMQYSIEQPARIVAARIDDSSGKHVFHPIYELLLADGSAYRAESELFEYGHPCRDSDCSLNPVTTTVFYDPKNPSDIVAGSRTEVYARFLIPSVVGAAAICFALIGRFQIWLQRKLAGPRAEGQVDDKGD